MAPSFSASSTSSSSSSSSSSLQHLIFSIKFKPLSSFKLKTLIFPHLHRIARPAKSLLLKLLRDTAHLAKFPPLMISKIVRHNTTSRKLTKKKVFFGSFRLHYNWCSSHKNVVMPLQQGQDIICNNVLLDSCRHDDGAGDDDDDNELSRYLEWLEDKQRGCCNNTSGQEFNEIDKLADLFIANCHEKFRLEKQESYRRFQEMMARSV